MAVKKVSALKTLSYDFDNKSVKVAESAIRIDDSLK